MPAWMNYCELTFTTPEENLACDEALLDLCEQGQGLEVLRLWEPSQYFIVVGYANKVLEEVHAVYCELNGIPIVRRCTGGGAVLQGPGVLNYSLILRAEGELHNISATNQFVMQHHQVAMATTLGARIEIQGHTDLAIGGLKFSGNSQRRKKQFLLFHGSILIDLNIEMVEKTLRFPSKEPDYRLGRSHSDFLINVKAPSKLIKDALRKSWNATHLLAEIPAEEIASLVRDKYGRVEWNHKF